MQKHDRLSRRLSWWAAGLALVMALAGCGGGGGSKAQPFTAPPQPVPGVNATQPFSVNTPNYFMLYTAETAPFDVNAQFANWHYPIPMNYVIEAPGPAGFDLVAENERAVQLWYQADPRVTIVSQVANGSERIKVKLVPAISYNNMNNILGLTILRSAGGNPYFEVLIAANDPLTHQPLTTAELEKTLTHELGHAFGLGHSPTQFDLMYFRANDFQGSIPRHFLTYGDAMAIWSTLNNRYINYVLRAAVTPAQGFVAQDTSRAAQAPGTVVCVYTQE
jgi:hypothetical protein